MKIILRSSANSSRRIITQSSRAAILPGFRSNQVEIWDFSGLERADFHPGGTKTWQDRAPDGLGI